MIGALSGGLHGWSWELKFLMVRSSELGLGTKNREPGTEPKEPGTGTEGTRTEKIGS
jgi:hypothetical protein